VVRDRAAFWAALAEDQDRPMLVDVPVVAVPVGASAEDVAVCVDTLLDNVFTHTPEGALIAVELTALPSGGARLTVADSGPGFPDPALAAERGVGTGRYSTGLGLDIARRAAAGSGGVLALGASRHGGASVAVEFGPPRDESGGVGGGRRRRAPRRSR
jgi:signal transduction histidine kinase